MSSSSKPKRPIVPDTPANRRLLTAITRNDAEMARRAFAEGASPTAMVARGPIQPVLNLAVRRGRNAVADVILEHGGDPGVVTHATVRHGGTTGEPLRYRPAFIIQALKGPIERTQSWLERYPSCNTPNVLAEALRYVPANAPDTYTLLLRAAQALPAATWTQSGAVVSELPIWTERHTLERVQDLCALAAPINTDLLTLGLAIAITGRKHEMAMWFLDQGADPLREVEENIYLRHGPRDIRGIAIQANQSAILAEIEARSAQGQVQTESAWLGILEKAMSHSARKVFHDMWRAGPGTEERKQKLFRTLRFPGSYEAGKITKHVSAIEWTVLRDEPSSWVREIIETGTTTLEDRTRAAHVLCQSIRWPSERTARALRTLVETGVDWEVPHPSSGLTVEAAIRNNKNLLEMPLVARLLAARQAAALGAAMPQVETPPAPGRRLRL